MLTWTLSDGTVLELGGKVTGQGRGAYLARRELALPILVPIGPPPSRKVPLDPKDPELLHAYAQGLARYLRLELVTEYKSTAPPPTEVEEGEGLVH